MRKNPGNLAKSEDRLRMLTGLSRRRTRLAFGLVALVLLVMPMRASADIKTVLTITDTANGNLAGSVQLFTTDASGAIVQLLPAVQFPGLGQGGVQTLTWDTVGTAACWIAVDGTFVDTQGSTLPMFAFSSDPSTWVAPAAGGPALLVDIGMLNGASFEAANGALVAFDGPEQVGTWSITETAPEPATLSLALVGLGLACVKGARRRKRLA